MANVAKVDGWFEYILEGSNIQRKGKEKVPKQSLDL